MQNVKNKCLFWAPTLQSGCGEVIFSCCVPKVWSKFSRGYTLEETGRGWYFGLAGTIFGTGAETEIHRGPHSGF